MPSIPPPLVLLGGALKPGLNHVAMINDLKANLSEKGIETAATFPDGTPNHLMIAMEETVKLMVGNIKTNAKIDKNVFISSIDFICILNLNIL